MFDNEFACPKGHKFRANAKLRARCPEHGLLARRGFEERTITEPEPVVTDGESTETPEPKKPVLLRQGRPRLMVKKASTPVPKKAVKNVAKAVTAKKKASARSVTKPTGKVSAGIVKTHRIVGRVTPSVSRKPKRTAIARHIKLPSQRSFTDSVMERFGPR